MSGVQKQKHEEMGNDPAVEFLIPCTIFNLLFTSGMIEIKCIL